MNNYWVIGTSADSHIKEYIKLISISNRVWVRIAINYQNHAYPEIIYNQKVIIKKGKNAFSQMLIGWEALGLIIRKNNDYYSLCFLKEMNEIIEYSKIFILKKNKNLRVNRYRITKLINILIISNAITFENLKNIGYKQKRGNLTIEKISKEISNYEKIISKKNDKNFLNKAKEIIC